MKKARDQDPQPLEGAAPRPPTSSTTPSARVTPNRLQTRVSKVVGLWKVIYLQVLAVRKDPEATTS